MPPITIRRLHPTDPELATLEARIIAQRNEYASWDLPEYQHIYTGFMYGRVDELLNLWAAEIQRTRVVYPASSFTLEYHTSCIRHDEYPFLVYSFTLIKSSHMAQGLMRELVILSWKLPRKASYDRENAAIEAFMAQHNIQAYDDGSGEVCQIRPDV